MATTNQEQLDKNNADFADQFNSTDEPKRELTEDEAFGLVDEAAPAAADADVDAASAAAPAAADPAATAQDDKAAEEKRLQEWEAELAAREAALNERDAAHSTTNADETQTGNANPADNDGAGGDAGGGAEDDPAKALAEDFGQEYVDLLTRLVRKVVGECIGDKIGGVEATVNSVIEHLNNQAHQAHFKAISAVHDDFSEVIESAEFEAYRAAQPPAEQAEIDRVVASGTAQELIDMLNKFKGSKEIQNADGVSDDELEAAEGVRSGGGLQLPPKPVNDQDYADAWNQA